jgi:archaeosine synthase
MDFKIKKRNGPARIGEFTIDKKEIKTPEILFINTKRFKSQSFANILITKGKNKTKKPSLKFSENLFFKRIKEKNNKFCFISTNENLINSNLKKDSAKIYVVTNALQLLDQPKNFVDFIITLRKKIGYQKIIYLPSVGEPKNLALLTYLCVDFFDSTKSIVAARNNILLFENGLYKTDELIENPCNCPSCFKLNKKPTDMKFQEILNHNYYAIIEEIKHVRNAIYQENLRNLVENRIKADPNLTSILRNLDRNFYEFLEKRTPTASKGKIIATTIESLYRPEIKRFQERVISRYKKPESTKILLLLPCSAKKPYSFSKSHKFFREKLLSTENPFVVHELIITSPIGIVPRELELVFPASSYDIPVTGIWDEIEKKIITNLLSKYLSVNKYEKIIVHLPAELTEFIKPILKEPVITCIDNPTSKKSLDNLCTVLNKNVKSYEKIMPQKRSKEDVEALASFQFGKKIAEKLIMNCEIKGKYPYQKIMFRNTQLGMVTKERGFISLTTNGAEKISKLNKYWVEIYSDFILKGSVFAPGIKDADVDIRVGDEVIVKRNEKICAVGVAQMNGEEMIESEQGEAIKIRHII